MSLQNTEEISEKDTEGYSIQQILPQSSNFPVSQYSNSSFPNNSNNQIIHTFDSSYVDEILRRSLLITHQPTFLSMETKQIPQQIDTSHIQTDFQYISPLEIQPTEQINKFEIIEEQQQEEQQQEDIKKCGKIDQNHSNENPLQESNKEIQIQSENNQNEINNIIQVHQIDALQSQYFQNSPVQITKQKNNFTTEKIEYNVTYSYPNDGHQILKPLEQQQQQIQIRLKELKKIQQEIHLQNSFYRNNLNQTFKEFKEEVINNVNISQEQLKQENNTHINSEQIAIQKLQQTQNSFNSIQENLNNQVSLLQKQLEDEKNQNDKIRELHTANIAQEKEKIDSLNVMVCKQKEEIGNLTEEIQKLQNKEIDQIQSETQIEELEKEKESILQDKDNLLNIIYEKNNQLEEKNRKIYDMQIHFEQNEKEIFEKHTNQLEQEQDRFIKICIELERKSQIITNMQEKQAELEKKEQDQEKSTILDELNQKQQIQIKELHENIQKVEQENNVLKIQNTVLKRQKEELQKSFFNLNLNFQQKEQQKSELQQNLNKEIFKSSILKKQKDELSKSSLNLNSTFKHLHEKEEILLNENKALKSQNQALEDDFKNQKIVFGTQNDQLIKENQELKLKYLVLNDENKQIEKNQESLENLGDNLLEKSGFIVILEARLEQNQNKITELSNENSILNEKNKEQTIQLGILEKKIDILCEKEKEFEQKIEQVCSQMSVLNLQNNVLRKQKEELQKSSKSLNNKIEEIHSKTEEKQKEQIEDIKKHAKQPQKIEESDKQIETQDVKEMQQNYNESLKKIKEERRLYGILQEENNKLQQQLETAKYKLNEQNNNSANSSASKAKSRPSFSETQDNRVKDLEATIGRLHLEQTNIRIQMKTKYEGQIQALNNQIKECEEKNKELVGIQEQYNQLKKLREEEEKRKSSLKNVPCQKEKNEYNEMVIKMQKQKEQSGQQLDKKEEEIKKLKRSLNQCQNNLNKFLNLHQIGQNCNLEEEIQQLSKNMNVKNLNGEWLKEIEYIQMLSNKICFLNEN